MRMKPTRMMEGDFNMRMPWQKKPYTSLVSLDAIAESAVARAIDPDYSAGFKIEAMPDGGTRTTVEADGFVVMKTEPDMTAVQPQEFVIRETKPEYHLGLAKRMISAFDANEAKILADMETESDRHNKLMADLCEELDGVRKVRAAYGRVGELLSEPDIEPVSPEKKPQRLTRGKRSTEKPKIVVDHAATE